MSQQSLVQAKTKAGSTYTNNQHAVTSSTCSYIVSYAIYTASSPSKFFEAKLKLDLGDIGQIWVKFGKI